MVAMRVATFLAPCLIAAALALPAALAQTAATVPPPAAAAPQDADKAARPQRFGFCFVMIDGEGRISTTINREKEGLSNIPGYDEQRQATHLKTMLKRDSESKRNQDG